MSKVVYSTIKEGDTGSRIAILVPYDLSRFDTEEDIALARAIHDDIQNRVKAWLEEESANTFHYRGFSEAEG